MNNNYAVSIWRPGQIMSQQFYNSLRLITFTFLLLFGYTSTNAQVIISEVFANGTFELRNTGNSTVNVSNYWICDFPDYRRLDQLTLECGDLNLAAGAEVVLTAPGLHETNDSELGLYTRNSFGDASALVSYLEWGSSGHQRAGLAVGNGIWDGNAAAAFNNNQSLERSGDGFSASDWTTNATPMACSDGGDETPICNVDGGTISTSDRTSICVDGIADPINVTVSGASGGQRGWVITDDQRNILALPAAPPFDLDGAGPGICFIYYIRYEDGLTGLATGQNLNNLQGCWDLSNRIEVVRQTPDGGTVYTQSGLTEFTATAGNVRVPVQFSTTATALSYWYIITDENDNILAFVNPTSTANPNNVVLDLSGAPAGECHIWGWSYRGEGDPIPGDNISTLTDGACEAISTNFIRVIRQAADVCPTPENLATKSLDARRTRVDWDKVTGAKQYKLEIRFAGQTKIIGRGLVRGNGVFVFAPAGRDYEVRVQTICQDGSQSAYSAWLSYSTPSNLNTSAQGRSRSNTTAETRNSEGFESIEILDQSITNITIYPNPIRDLLNIDYKTTSGTAVLTVFHVSGKQIINQPLAEDASYHQVNLSNLADGVYLLTIQEAGKLPYTERVIKGSR